MKKIKFIVFCIAIVFCILLTGCTNEKKLGGDKDEHGCIGSAGYSWCEIKQKCLRSWEENCQEKITLGMALEIAMESECTEKGFLSDKTMYNENSRTWWIDLEMKEEFYTKGCSPACVVSEEKKAEINWRCTGALPPVDEFCFSPNGTKMEINEARAIGEGACKDGFLKDFHTCNNGTGTWWIAFDANDDEVGCNPACVVNIETKAAEINWRCTGIANN